MHPPTDPIGLREWIAKNKVTIAELENMNNILLDRLLKAMDKQLTEAMHGRLAP